ncbi:unnamed protein product [Thlaspi arvense]|uniref:Uncharacterized protein n=1 Tax=Thlaspi arvense TaxID=13288 RepID=A0AAU9SRR8_THLAR|nr:unnamed protein product [Thlaspi arvense]
MTMTMKKPMKYVVSFSRSLNVAIKQADAFTDSAFKGNQAAVCFLDVENERDDSWLQSLASEFNLPMTCFLIPVTGTNPLDPPRFILRWFTRFVEMDICGLATLASAHTLFSNGLVGSSDTVEFATHSGILTAKRVPETLEFEATIVDIKGTTTAITVSKALNGVAKAASTDKIIVVLPSWEAVTELEPRMDEISKCPGKMIIVTASAPQGSAYDFVSRVFGPKIGVDEVSVCGSAHCALAHYWSLKMNKCDFVTGKASYRSGKLKLHFDKEKERVLLTGKAVTVMKGSVLVDAFTETAFKGNQAAVCFLDENHERDDSWLQSLAAEFDLPLTCFLVPITGSDPPRFLLRWFTSVAEMDICGHATLASAHCIFSNSSYGTVEFSTHSGILTAKRLDDCGAEGSFLIEVNFPVIETCDHSSNDVSMISKALNGAAIVDVRGTTTDKLVFKPLKGSSKSTSTDQIMVVLSSWESVTQLQPRIDDLMKCPGKVMIVTAAAPEGSAFDFCSRLFAPKLGLNEDSVCGSAHCSLAHYWSLKMNKSDFVAYAASQRSGTVKVRYDKEKQRVLLTGKAVTVMKGYVLV